MSVSRARGAFEVNRQINPSRNAAFSTTIAVLAKKLNPGTRVDQIDVSSLLLEDSSSPQMWPDIL